MVRIMTKTAKAFITVFLALVLMIQPGIARPQEKVDEVKLGKESVAELEKEIKLYKDPEALKRVRTIGNALAEVANTVEVPAGYGSSEIIKFDYVFKIVDDKDVNAFSIPGGFIYVNKGLLDYIESDHELAGVLAHEVAHASHHHMVQLMKEQSRVEGKVALLLALGLIAKVPGNDLGNIVLGAQLYKIAKISGYGIEAEKDADNSAIHYMLEAGYNPVGLLTFLERLARKPELVSWGIYQTHPDAPERPKEVEKTLRAMNVPINRREVRNAPKAVVRSVEVLGNPVSEVVFEDNVLYRPATENGIASSERAEQVADKLNLLLDDGLQLRDIKVPTDRPTVLARGEPLIEVSVDDAALSDSAPMDVAQQAAEDIRRVLWRQMVDGMY